MSLGLVGGCLAAFIILLMGVFAGGRRDGKKTMKINGLKADLELREHYEKIDNTLDVADPFSLL